MKEFTEADAREIAELLEATRGAYELTMKIEATDGTKYKIEAVESMHQGTWLVTLFSAYGVQLTEHRVDLYAEDAASGIGVEG